MIQDEGDTKPMTIYQPEKLRLWDASDVAGYLKASRSWVYHQAEKGHLPCMRIAGLLRFDPEAIKRFARGQ
jgi:hypothetical protein